MRYKIVNQFDQGIVEVDLTEKELQYIHDIAKGEEKDNVMTSLCITSEEIETIYTKFGLTNKNRDRDVQVVVIAMMNKLVNID